jgi:hypothetical protein
MKKVQKDDELKNSIQILIDFLGRGARLFAAIMRINALFRATTECGQSRFIDFGTDYKICAMRSGVGEIILSGRPPAVDESAT